MMILVLPPPIGYVHLYQAVQAIGQTMHGTNWVSVRCQDELKYQVHTNLTAIDDVIRLIAEGCESGRLAAAYPTKDGSVDKIDGSEWSKTRWRNYFYSGTIDLDLPLGDSGQTVPCTRKIFVRKDSLGELVKSLPAPVTAPKGRRGRRAGADWDALDLALRQRIDELGFPSEDNDYPDWRIKADVERWATEFLEDRKEPIKESRLREKITQLLNRIEAGN